MTDAINISNVNSGAAGSSRRLYQSEGVREVQSRAKFLEQVQTPQEQAGLQRLNRLLAHGGSLDQGAPRGYYLNINV